MVTQLAAQITWKYAGNVEIMMILAEIDDKLLWFCVILMILPILRDDNFVENFKNDMKWFCLDPSFAEKNNEFAV